MNLVSYAEKIPFLKSLNPKENSSLTRCRKIHRKVSWNMFSISWRIMKKWEKIWELPLSVWQKVMCSKSGISLKVYIGKNVTLNSIHFHSIDFLIFYFISINPVVHWIPKIVSIFHRLQTIETQICKSSKLPYCSWEINQLTSKNPEALQYFIQISAELHWYGTPFFLLCAHWLFRLCK